MINIAAGIIEAREFRRVFEFYVEFDGRNGLKESIEDPVNFRAHGVRRVGTAFDARRRNDATGIDGPGFDVKIGQRTQDFRPGVQDNGGRMIDRIRRDLLAALVMQIEAVSGAEFAKSGGGFGNALEVKCVPTIIGVGIIAGE